MLRAPAFGKGSGWPSMVLGMAGVAAGSVLLVDARSPIAFVGVLALIIFHILLGSKVYGLGTQTAEAAIPSRR